MYLIPCKLTHHKQLRVRNHRGKTRHSLTVSQIINVKQRLLKHKLCQWFFRRIEQPDCLEGPLTTEPKC